MGVCMCVYRCACVVYVSVYGVCVLYVWTCVIWCVQIEFECHMCDVVCVWRVSTYVCMGCVCLYACMPGCMIFQNEVSTFLQTFKAVHVDCFFTDFRCRSINVLCFPCRFCDSQMTIFCQRKMWSLIFLRAQCMSEERKVGCWKLPAGNFERGGLDVLSSQNMFWVKRV